MVSLLGTGCVVKGRDEVNIKGEVERILDWERLLEILWHGDGIIVSVRWGKLTFGVLAVICEKLEFETRWD